MAQNDPKTKTSDIKKIIASGKYHIVAGAFRIAANAHKKVRKLKAQGFDAYIIGVNKYGLHQVVYKSYENRLEALRALRKIKKEQKFRSLAIGKGIVILD